MRGAPKIYAEDLLSSIGKPGTNYSIATGAIPPRTYAFRHQQKARVAEKLGSSVSEDLGSNGVFEE